MQKRLLALMLVLCTMLLVSCNGRKTQTSITFSENGVLTAEVITTSDGSMLLPQPAGTHAAFCVGWTASVEGENIFLPIGATFSYQSGDDIDFTPVYLHMTTLPSATLDISTADVGILYTTTVEVGEIDRLTSIGANPKFDTLIVTDTIRQQLSEFTYKALSDAVSEYVLHEHTTTVNESKNAFSSVLKSVPSQKLVSYAGIGYATITYSNGETSFIYAETEDANIPSASIFALAKAATQDLSDTREGAYQTPVEDKFSPYTAEEYAILKSYGQFTLTLIFNNKLAGNRGLSEDLLEFFNQRTIQQGDKNCEEEWKTLRDIITDIRQNGALVITAKDNTYINRGDVSAVTFQNNSIILTLQTAVYYNGSIYIPYTTWSQNV